MRHRPREVLRDEQEEQEERRQQYEEEGMGRLEWTCPLPHSHICTTSALSAATLLSRYLRGVYHRPPSTPRTQERCRLALHEGRC